MAAVHRRKRPNGLNADGSSTWDSYGVKKKKSGSIKNRSNSKSHISLEWDDRQNKVVAKKNQISLSKRDLGPFSASTSKNRNSLADVISVPSEIYSLENLKGVLSTDVWKNVLSESERKSLIPFLPHEYDEDVLVDALLSGENFHFGNTFLQWSFKLCSGNLHPDFVNGEEQCLVNRKKAYYSEIQNYHADMIIYLQKLKSALENSKTTEMKDLQEIWRPCKALGDNSTKLKKNFRFSNCEDEVAATSNSSSWNEEDKACSSDNQVSSLAKNGSLKQRFFPNYIKAQRRHPVLSDDVGIAQNVHQHEMEDGDGASYMSYVKITKKQYDLVKNLKQAGKIVHSKSLGRLLSTTGPLNVQPFEEFEKEEMKKTHEHWLKLVMLDLPTAYLNMQERREQRRETLMLLCQGVEEYEKSPEEERINNSELLLHDKVEKRILTCNNNEENEYDGESSVHQLLEQTDKMSRYQETCFENDGNGSIPFQTHVEHSEAVHEGSVEIFDGAVSDSNNSTPQAFQAPSDSNQSRSQEFEEDDVQSPSNGHSLNTIDGKSADILTKENTLQASMEPLIQFSSVGSLYMNDSINRVSSTSGNGFSRVADNRDTNSAYQGVGFSSNRDIYSLPVHNVVPSISQRAALSSNGGMYGVDANGDDPSANNGVNLSSVGGFYPVYGNDADIVASRVSTSSGVNSPILQEPVSCGKDGWSMVNMGQCYYNSSGKEYSSIDVQQSALMEMEENTRKRLLQRHCDESSFNSYSLPDRNGLLQSLFHCQDLPYQADQKHSGLDFRSQSNVLLQDGSFHGGLHPLMAIEQGKKVNVENYIPQNNDLYPESNGYLIPRQGHINLSEWAPNSVQVQSHIPGEGILPHKWYPGDSQLRGNWTHSNGLSSQSIGTSGDQGLYSVLSHCNQLRSDGSFEAIPSTDQVMLPRNYSMIGSSSGGSRIGNNLPQLPHPLEFFGSQSSPSATPSGWVNLPQSSSSHDSMGKPFLRSWNQ